MKRCRQLVKQAKKNFSCLSRAGRNWVARAAVQAETPQRMKCSAALLALAPLWLFCGCSRPASPAPEPPPPPAEAKAAEAKAAQTKPEAVAVDAAAFVGTWATSDAQGQAFDVVIFPGGQAVSTWVKGPGGAHGERGFWRTERGRLLVVFHDGWTDEIVAKGGAYVHRGFEPGADLGGIWKNEAAARKVEDGGFTGIWQLNKEPDGSTLYVALQSCGRAFSTVGGGREGKWSATKDGALCSWPDGWNDLISPSQGGHQKRSWVGPEEQNATPPDISPATRVGNQKFTISP
ncbi:MAG: hypothetical protein WCS65_01010 [Verrucomicrobiae bacterium]